MPLEFLDGFGQRLRGLLAEEVSGHALHHGFESSAATICNAGPSGSRNFERCHAKIFFAGKDQCPAPRNEILNLGVG